MNHFVTVCSRTAVAAACTAGTAVVSSAGIVAAGRDTVGSWDIAFLPSRSHMQQRIDNRARARLNRRHPEVHVIDVHADVVALGRR